MKKVLYVSPNGYLGGAERFLLTAVKAHSLNNNIEASILFFSNGEACQEAKESGLKYYVLKQAFRFRQPWNLFKALLEIRSLVKQNKPDILHLTMPYSHIALSLACLGIKNIKTVWFQHGPLGGRLDRVGSFFSADILLFNSKDLQIRHHLLYPSSKGKIDEHIINHGISSVKGTHVLFANSPLKIGIAGRICSWKGFHNLLIAIGELKQSHKLIPFKVKIAGSVKRPTDQEYKNQLLQITENYQLKNEVIFLDHQVNMEQFYHDIDIFVHSAVTPEPFGLVVAEAMLNGCLVIASDMGGVQDLVLNDKTGLNFPSTTKQAIPELKNKLSIFLVDNNQTSLSLYQKIADQGRLHIEKNYSVKQMVDQLENIYLKL